MSTTVRTALAWCALALVGGVLLADVPDRSGSGPIPLPAEPGARRRARRPRRLRGRLRRYAKRGPPRGRSLLGGFLLVPRRPPARRNRCRRTRHRVELFPEGDSGRPFPCRSTDGTGATCAESTELRLRVEAAG